MFYHDNKLQYEVKVDKPNPLFAKALQQAIGGQEGEMRVCLQYLFQAWNQPPSQSKYRDMLLNTGTEEISHIEILCTAVALNLEGAPTQVQDEAAENPMVAAILGGMQPRQFLSAGLGAMPVDANGGPFTGNYIVASGNLAGDMYANVMAESTGRTLAARLYHMTDDAGMKDMLRFLLARDTMHQNQWLAVIEELGGVENVHPIPASIPMSEEQKGPHVEEMNLSYAFMSTHIEPQDDPGARYTSGRSIDGKGEFSFIPKMEPLGGEPQLPEPPPSTFDAATPQDGAKSGAAGLVQKAKDALS
ncbi:manganese catalase family protein [Rubrivirga sp. S365]|uniref:Manganese catalase family protein n=1 Tax=Rubrivirga litoralis TaxID=3075598 RepID=A0ABU3BU37_9BACT|nr:MULTISPECIES: manganese catalase family protein [unclassified Rubrivirga]MDT0632808.1 manganese catalase family protein [Rubrivirga sp. F394]MDT7857499.1 manganese catalase family protein [Rubrivirga sp. S365]